MKKLILLSAICVLFASCDKNDYPLIQVEIIRVDKSVDTIFIRDNFLIDPDLDLRETRNQYTTYRTIAKNVISVKRLDK